MRQIESQNLMEYILFEMTRLEQDVQQLRQNLRYRDVDVVDCMELMLALERLVVFKQFSGNVIQLLKLRGNSVSKPS